MKSWPTRVYEHMGWVGLSGVPGVWNIKGTCDNWILRMYGVGPRVVISCLIMGYLIIFSVSG